MKRKLIEFSRIGAEMREVVNILIRRERGLLGDDLDPYFRDVYDHLLRNVDMIESYRDLLTGSLDTYLSAVANRTNEVTAGHQEGTRSRDTDSDSGCLFRQRLF